MMDSELLNKVLIPKVIDVRFMKTTTGAPAPGIVQCPD